MTQRSRLWSIASLILIGIVYGTWYYVEQNYGEDIGDFVESFIDLPERFDRQEARQTSIEARVLDLHNSTLITDRRYSTMVQKANKIEVLLTLYLSQNKEHTSKEIKNFRNDMGNAIESIGNDLGNMRELIAEVREGIEYTQGALVGRLISVCPLPQNE